MSFKNGTDSANMDVDSGKNSQGGNGGFNEEMIALNEDFISYLQEAVRGAPDACLAPIVMDYMEYLMELILNKNPNLLGDDRNSIKNGKSVKDFSNVGKFFQKLKSDSFNVPTFTDFISNAVSSSSTTLKSNNNFAFTSTATTAPSLSTSSTSNNPNSGIALGSAKNSTSTTGSTEGISPFNRATTGNSVNWGSGSMPWQTANASPATATKEISKATTIPPAAPSSTPSVAFASFATPTFSFGTKPDANAVFGLASNPPANKSVVPAAPTFGSTFSFSSNFNSAPQATTTPVNGAAGANNDDSDDEGPPKPDHKPVVEDDSVFTQRVKLFELEDKKYKDLGIGNLFIKKLPSGKHQLVIRADTSLGTILMNTVLNSSMPMKLLKPANILASVPSTEGKVKTYIFRVKDAEMGEELLKNLDKFKEES